MYKKKIGIFSIISVVMGTLAFIFSIMSIAGAPFFISLILGGVSIISGILALILKNKVAIPVVGIVLSVVAVIASVGILAVSNIDFEVDSDKDSKSKKESSQQEINEISNNSINEMYNINNSVNISNELSNEISTNIVNNTINTNTAENTTNGQRVGNSEMGYVTVPSNWTRFFDPDSPSGTFQYSYANVYIITLFSVDKNGLSAETYAKYLESELKDEGTTNVTSGPATIGKYNAYKVQGYYSSENIWLDCYYFETEDGKMHYVAMEGPDKNSEYFKIPNTFKINE